MSLNNKYEQYKWENLDEISRQEILSHLPSGPSQPYLKWRVMTPLMVNPIVGDINDLSLSYESHIVSLGYEFYTEYVSGKGWQWQFYRNLFE